MKITKSKDIVDDNKLLASVWYIQIKKMEMVPEDISGRQVLDLVANRKLANAESVRRSRAKFQELREDLRGKIYASRHSHIKDVKQELKSFTS